MTAYLAQLRVYEPLAAFSGSERAHWEDYVAAGPPDRARAGAIERAATLRASAMRPAGLPDPGEHALVAEVDGVTVICPLRTRVRAAEALADFCAGLPEELADAFVSRAVAEAAEREVQRWREASPDRFSHVLTSTWQVPPRWFVLVEAGERQMTLGDHDASRRPAGNGRVAARRSGRELVYRTAMSRARRRTARALAVLRRTLDEEAVTVGVEDLGRWLEEFHPRSMVELDYGHLVHLVNDDALSADESAADIAEALAGLADGDHARAATSYRRVTARMTQLQSVESAN